MVAFKHVISSIVVVSASSTGAVFAQAPAAKPDKPALAVPQALRTPAPQLDTLIKPYEGDWKCETTFAAGAWGPGKPATKVNVTMKITKEMGGLWYRGEYEVEKTATIPPGRAVFVVGYDILGRSLVMAKYDNTGTLVLATAAGATPEKQVFVGDASAGGTKAKFRDTLTRKAPKEFEHVFERDTGKGFQLLGTEICTK